MMHSKSEMKSMMKGMDKKAKGSKGGPGKGPHDAGQATKTYNHTTNGVKKGGKR